MNWMTSLPPGSLLLVGGLLLWWMPRTWSGPLAVVLPILSLAHQWALVPGEQVAHVSLWGWQLTTVRADTISHIWGSVFHIAAALAALFAASGRNRTELASGLTYAGAAIAAVFAGDLLTLFFAWELTAVTSVFLVWERRTPGALRSGIRYLVQQVGSGVLLLAGILFLLADGQSLQFGLPGETGVFTSQFATTSSLGSWLLLLAFGVKAAFPLLHGWLPDAYPRATAGGAVFLSIFTTKMAVYALLRGFGGTDLLIGLGAIMAVFPLVYGLLENDLRRVLAYSLISQLGYMVAAVGVGTPMAVNGVAAHAVAHILYKGLLFMVLGNVLLRTGTTKATRLGGLAADMPVAAICCAIAAASLSAVPLFAGFVSKSYILAAVAEADAPGAYLALLVASAGVLLYCGLKVPVALFGGPRRTIPHGDTPLAMQAAMIIAAAGCVVLGAFPQYTLARWLPYTDNPHAYTAAHVVTQLQLLAFAGLSYVVLVRAGICPRPREVVYWDVDRFWSHLLPAITRNSWRVYQQLSTRLTVSCRGGALWAVRSMALWSSGEGEWCRTRATGWMALWAAVLLVSMLLIFYHQLQTG